MDPHVQIIIIKFDRYSIIYLKQTFNIIETLKVQDIKAKIITCRKYLHYIISMKNFRCEVTNTYWKNTFYSNDVKLNNKKIDCISQGKKLSFLRSPLN